MGEGSSEDITSPVLVMAVMCGVGQREDGGWDKGMAGWKCTVGVDLRKDELRRCWRLQQTAEGVMIQN